MKKILFLPLFFISFSGFSKMIPADSAIAGKTNAKEKFIITAGVGFNATLINYHIQYRLSSESHQRVQKTHSTPMFNLMVDYKIMDRLTVGVACGYQQTKAYWNDVYHDHIDGSYVDSYTRLHFAVRGDYYLMLEKKWTIYCGLRVGYNYYKLNSTTYIETRLFPLPYYPTDFAPVSAQVHYGFSYWLSNRVGFNVESGIGYGGPYLIAGGITAKF